MTSLLQHVKACTTLSNEQVGAQLASRTGNFTINAELVRAWDAGEVPIPAWVADACVLWILELWRAERDQCLAADLWRTDLKYMRMLQGFTLKDLLQRLKNVPA